MGDFIRYIFSGDHDLTLTALESTLKEIDPQFFILPDQAIPNIGDLLHAEEVYGEIEINYSSDQVFAEDLEDLRDQLADLDGEGKTIVLQALDKATGMIALQLSPEGHEFYRQIDPLWDWLFDNYPGLLQIDEEGYYSQNEQILAVD